jgi:hypothetical protein
VFKTDLAERVPYSTDNVVVTADHLEALGIGQFPGGRLSRTGRT